MSQGIAPMGVTPFPSGYRASGVLLHITSLPSRYGIGDFGPAAMHWIDRLHDAGQQWWQALPLGPTGYGESPYQPLCTFAGNGLLISPDALVEEGLLNHSDLHAPAFAETRVDYEAVVTFKHNLLPILLSRFRSWAGRDLKAALDQFRLDQAQWLDDYALFRAIKARMNGAPYLRWPRELIERDPAALAKARRESAETIDAIILAQFLLFRQMRRLREYANERHIRLIGDVPFFVAPDSSDVWVHPELFLLDDQRRPLAVAGVPPDLFSKTGQRWGNPVYNWPAHRASGFRWWVERFRSLLECVDLVRLDHFRAFAAAWHVPADAPTAETGHWTPGPGVEFFNAMNQQLGRLPFIAEDLGIITPDVVALRDRFAIPGTRVLQFAFDGDPDNPFLPEHYPHNCVAYTGTHDNNTTRGWYEHLPANQRRRLWKHLKRRRGESADVAWEMIRLAMSSVAALAIIPLQDVLNLGQEARMNVPGSPSDNWRWRCTQAMVDSSDFDRLQVMTRATHR